MSEQLGEAIPQEVTEAGAKALAHVRHLAGVIGPRPAGSAAEAAAADYVRQSLARMGLGPVHVQTFLTLQSTRLPRAAACASALLGLALWALLRGASVGGYVGAVLCGLGLWEVLAQITYTWAPLERLAPKVPSRNVVAKVHPAGEPVADAVVFAHLDTQTTPIFSHSKSAATAFYALLYLALTVLLLTAAALVISALAGLSLPLWVGAPGAVLAGAMLVAMVHSHLAPYGCGANDNASSVGVALALAEHFSKAPLPRTHLWLVFTGAEEAGCRGARAFLAEYGEELGPAYVLALEALGVLPPRYAVKEGVILTRRSDPELIQVAEHVGLPPVALKGGGTEAGMATRLGYRSLAVLGADEDGYLPYWHHPGDTAEVIEAEALAASWGATAAILRQLDRSLSRSQAG